MQLAFHTSFLLAYPVRDAVRMVLDAGYDAVELNAETHPWTNPHIDAYTPSGVISELAKMGPYSAISVHHDDFGSADPDRRRASNEWTGKLLDRAVDLNVGLIHVIPGSDAKWEPLLSSLREAVEYGERKGVTVALEPIVNRVVGTSAMAQKVLDAVPGLKINFDPSHLHVMGDDIGEATRSLLPKIAHVHLKDARGTPERWAFTALGEGEIDMRSMFAILAEADYRGFVSVEHESHIFDGDVRSPKEVLPQSRRFFTELTSGLKQVA